MTNLNLWRFSMKYEEIKLNISNDKISNYKVFKGMTAVF